VGSTTARTSGRCDDGWYVRPGNGPGYFHIGKSPVFFVDGHVDLCSAREAEFAYEAFYHQPDFLQKTPFR
jgi:prepilin-type processing-associated H-X9-DG protein